MNIWEQLYGDFLHMQRKEDGPGYDGPLAVEAMVEELRRRVGLQALSASDDDSMQKQASLTAFAKDDPLIDIIATAMVLASRPLADKMAILKKLEEIFPDHKDIIRENREYLYERIGGKVAPPAPVIETKLEAVDEKKDSQLFEGIADKLKR